MATIGKIRKRSTLLLIIVGGALVLFVLSDFLSGNRGGRRPKQSELAIVNGKKIHAGDFFKRFEDQFDIYKMQYGDNMQPNMVFQIKEEVFNELIRQTILQHQYEKIGLKVSQAEMVDMMTGVNIHPIIKQNFIDPQTKQFNPTAVQNYLLNLDNLEPQQQKQWYTLEKIMKEDRFHEKYQNLIKKSYFLPGAMAASIYEKQGKTANIKLISLKYSDIPDDEITLTEQDFKRFYEKNKNQYEQEDSRWLEYIIFEVNPSQKDLESGETLVKKFYEEFAQIPYENTSENYAFVNLKSDLDFNSDSSFMKRAMLPAQADSIFDMPVGSIVGPYSENNSYYIIKLLKKSERADSLRASHILIAYKGAQRAEPNTTLTKEQAQSKADSLLAVVKGKDSATFAQIAKQFSTDPSAQTNGGDLNWFQDGSMVYTFNEACQKAKVGDYFTVESPFGVHVVHLTGKKAFMPKVQVAMLKYTIEASSETMQQVYTEASKFAGNIKSPEYFKKVAEENGYIIRTSEYTQKSDYSIPGVIEGREIVRWTFGEDIKDGAISPVFELVGENKNVVVMVKRVRNKGIAPLEHVKELIEPLVKREKKSEIQFEKMKNAAAGAQSIDEIAKKLNIEVQLIESVSFSSPNVPLIGHEPKVVGTIFGTEIGKRSRIIKGETAVFIVEPIEINNAPEINDYSSIVLNQRGMFQNRASFDVYNALKKKAKVKDNRILFY